MARSHPSWSAATWGLLIAVCGAIFLDGLDVSMVGVALPSIRTDLGLSTSQLQWVVSGYVLGYGGLLLLGGRAADLLGRRRVFLIAVSVFAVASLLGALAGDPNLLVATRLIKGAAAAFTAPAALPIITTGMVLLVRTVVRAPSVGWSSATTIVSFAIAAAILAGFVAIERRSDQPLVRLGILRSPGLLSANVGAAAMAGCYFGFQFVATLYLQAGLGWSALHMALAFLPAGLLVAFGSTRVGALAGRLGTQRLAAAGFVAFVAGYALFLRVSESPGYAVDVLPSIVLLGLGFALAFPSLNIQATNGIADHEQGLASGLLQTSFQVGGALVLAVVSAVVTSQAGSSPDAASLLDALRPTLAIVTGIAALGLIVISGRG